MPGLVRSGAAGATRSTITAGGGTRPGNGGRTTTPGGPNLRHAQGGAGTGMGGTAAGAGTTIAAGGPTTTPRLASRRAGEPTATSGPTRLPMASTTTTHRRLCAHP